MDKVVETLSNLLAKIVGSFGGVLAAEQTKTI